MTIMVSTMTSFSDCARNVEHEGLIDLQLVDRQLVQIAQRRVTRAEMIHRKANTYLLQLVHGSSSFARQARVDT